MLQNILEQYGLELCVSITIFVWRRVCQQSYLTSMEFSNERSFLTHLISADKSKMSGFSEKYDIFHGLSLRS